MTNNTELPLGRKWLNALQVLFGITPAVVFLATWGMNEGNAAYDARMWFCFAMIGLWLILVFWNGALRRRDRKANKDDD